MSLFRTIEISDPQFELDNLRHITVKSNNLKGRGDITVYVPKGVNQSDLPAVILLHGVYGSHWSWAFRGGIHKLMNKWISEGLLPPMLLIMPSDGLWGDGSGYVNHGLLNFENWIVEDVINAVLEKIPQFTIHSQLSISGLSMGGYGALRLGAIYNHKFSGMSGLSSMTHFDQMVQFSEEDLTNIHLSKAYGKSILEVLISQKDKLPAFRFDCGLSDELLSANRELHNQLIAESIPHVYKEYDGGHDWEYWSKNIFESLSFFISISEQG